MPDFSTYSPGTTRLNAIAVDDEASAPVFPLDSGADDGGLLIDDNGSRTSGSEGDGDVATSQTV
ncbi:MAG: hypothetical protein U5O39_15315 [Gammaproteobacteria bacterium]|nr:hypothetical protein [Gammaproteobacteria bacterium]